MSLSLISDLPPVEIDLLRDAWKHWGMDLQMAVCEEELSELGEAITLAHMDGAHWSDGVFEELADVIICISQIEVVLKAHPVSHPSPHRSLWGIVEDRGHTTHLIRFETAYPDELLLLYTLRLKKTFAKSRRYNGGSVVWGYALLSEIGAFISCLSVVAADLHGRRHKKCGDLTDWGRVMEYRSGKLGRLRVRLEDARRQGASS